jgi:hypothetical protein
MTLTREYSLKGQSVSIVWLNSALSVTYTTSFPCSQQNPENQNHTQRTMNQCHPLIYLSLSYCQLKSTYNDLDQRILTLSSVGQHCLA